MYRRLWLCLTTARGRNLCCYYGIAHGDALMGIYGKVVEIQETPPTAGAAAL